MNSKNYEDTHRLVQTGYEALADGPINDPNRYATEIGYAEEELNALPEGANLGLGCGNPTALAHLAEGDVVVDLGSGAGIDALLAARKVGGDGRVIGIDMTPAMLEKARKNAVEARVARTVEFREGTIEALPIRDAVADVVISNCVINLSPDKARVFKEAFRVLKPGGRLAISDILLSEPLPSEIAGLAAAHIACIAGAALADDYLEAIASAGFVDASFTRTSAAGMLGSILSLDVAKPLLASVGADQINAVAETVWSYKIQATKP